MIKSQPLIQAVQDLFESGTPLPSFPQGADSSAVNAAVRRWQPYHDDERVPLAAEWFEVVARPLQVHCGEKDPL